MLLFPHPVVSTLQYELYLLHPDKPDKIERGVRTHVQCRFSNFDMTHRRLPITSGDILQFRRRLLRWYDRHKRDLPSRQDRDAYRVWLAEMSNAFSAALPGEISSAPKCGSSPKNSLALRGPVISTKP